MLTAARQNLSARDAQLAEHLAKIDQNLHDLEHERRLVARERQVLSDAETQVRSREEALRQREETFRRKTEDRLDERLRDARREIDRVIDDLKKKTADLAAEAERRLAKRAGTGPPISTGDAGAARVEARQALDEAAARFRGDERGTPAATGGRGRPAGGRRPGGRSRASASRACSSPLHGDEAEIDMLGKRLRARVGGPARRLEGRGRTAGPRRA